MLSPKETFNGETTLTNCSSVRPYGHEVAIHVNIGNSNRKIRGRREEGLARRQGRLEVGLARRKRRVEVGLARGQLL